MSAKQFEHFLNLQQGLADLNRRNRRVVRSQPQGADQSESAVNAAKIWLAATIRPR